MDVNETLRLRRAQADAYAAANNLDMWGTRVAWFALSEGVPTARRLCSKYNKSSQAWLAYSRLRDAGLFLDSGEEIGIAYNPQRLWEEGDGPLLWLNALAQVGAGGERHPLL